MIGAHDAAPDTVREPPSLDEIYDYAAYLGLDTALDHELLWIADEALQADDPEGWEQAESPAGDTYYIQVKRNSNAAGSCQHYELEITNGDAP